MLGAEGALGDQEGGGGGGAGGAVGAEGWGDVELIERMPLTSISLSLFPIPQFRLAPCFLTAPIHATRISFRGFLCPHAPLFFFLSLSFLFFLPLDAAN